MFNEQVNLNTHENMVEKFNTTNVENVPRTGIVGIFTDTIRHADGRVEVIEGRNTIVENIGKLIACLMKGEASYGGVKYWAVGTGSTLWDVANPTPAATTDTKCVTELYRKAINPGDITFVDSGGSPTGTVTNSIQITVTFTESEANGQWREFAIFGGNATTVKDSGLALNHKTHGLIVKTSSMTIERKIRFIFN